MTVRHERISGPPASRGTSTLELLVALTLLASVLALATPLIIAHGRLLKAQRDYRLALDELSNQLELLSTLPAADLPAAIDKITPSPLTAERLGSATLSGHLADADFGRRVTLEITWDEPNRRAAPLRLTGWILAQPAPMAGSKE